MHPTILHTILYYTIYTVYYTILYVLYYIYTYNTTWLFEHCFTCPKREKKLKKGFFFYTFKTGATTLGTRVTPLSFIAIPVIIGNKFLTRSDRREGLPKGLNSTIPAWYISDKMVLTEIELSTSHSETPDVTSAQQTLYYIVEIYIAYTLAYFLEDFLKITGRRLV